MAILKYNETKMRLLAMITAHGLKAGDRIPTEPELAEKFGVSVISLRRAVAELQEAGIIIRKQGKGSFYTGKLTRSHYISKVGLVSVRDSHFPDGTDNSPMLEKLRKYNADYRIFHVEDDVDTSLMDEIMSCDRFILNGFCNIQWLDFLLSTGKPVVQIGAGLHHEKVCQIKFDWESAFEQMIRRLKDNGYRNIGLLLIHPSAANCSEGRRDLFREAVRKAGLTFREDSAVYVDPLENYRSILEYMDGPGKDRDVILTDYHVFNNLTAGLLLHGRKLEHRLVIMQTYSFMRDEVNREPLLGQVWFSNSILAQALEILYEFPISFIEEKKVFKIDPVLQGMVFSGKTNRRSR